MTKKTFFISLLAGFAFISLLANCYLIFVIAKNIELFDQRQINKKVLEFRNMFTEKILLSGKEIDFDTRLTMETAVRGLNDSEIFSQWRKFTDSQTKEGATLEAKKLLELLIRKTTI